MTKPVCVVIGIGPGNGAAFSRRFAAEGYAVAMLSRSTDLSSALAAELDGARAYACDVSDVDAVKSAFASVRADMGEVDVLVYNAGSGVFGNVEEITPEAFEKSWRINTLGALVAAQEVIPAMTKAGHGSIVLIGASASLRGGANFAAFAPAKAGQRILAQSMARHLWPRGVHVSYVVIDGMIGLPRTRQAMPDKTDDQFLAPADIAATVFHLTQQNKSAWSFEVEARPFVEKW